MKHKEEKLLEILKGEVKPALGCTGPTAVSFVVSVAQSIVGGTPSSVRVIIDKDMSAKNDDVGIPGTSEKGIDVAAALGAICGDPDAGLEVLRNVSREDELQAVKFAKEAVVVETDWDFKPIGLYVEAIVTTDKGTGRAVIAKTHTNIVLKERNGKPIFQVSDFDRYYAIDEKKDPIRGYTIEDLYKFSMNVPYNLISFLRQAVELNMNLAQAGLADKKTRFGKAFARITGDEAVINAKKFTSAASEARMVGTNLAAMSCATSGNVGITASLPLVAVAEAFHKNEEELIRALCLSYLLTIYGKNHIGRLSAMCSCCVAASLGVAAGTSTLLGGSYEQAELAIQNTAACIFGVVCDGARIACSVKLAFAAGTAIESAYLAHEGVGVPFAQGVLGRTAEETFLLLGRIAREGMLETDKVLCREMYDRNRRIKSGEGL